MLPDHLISKLDMLLPSQTAKFAIAYSGGADSTALLHALKDHTQLKAVYIVDHGLRVGSDIEAQHARDFAVNLGLHTEILTWQSPQLTSGIQTQARLARYGLMGQACRIAGIDYLLTAHHSDDQAETLFMRFEHETGWRGAAGMAETTYAPLWPELACVTVLRPLLDVPRAQLRAYARDQNLNWAEDPSNKNQSFERVRAREYLARNSQMSRNLLASQKEIRNGLEQERKYLADFAKAHVKINENGIIRLCELCPPELLYYLLRIASGEGRLICRKKIKRLMGEMKLARFTSATLGGALIRRNPSEHGYLICRDLVSVKGRKDNDMPPRARDIELAPYHQIWDGRFMCMGPSEYRLVSAHSARNLMTNEDLRRLREHPAAVRQTLPIVIKDNKIVEIGEHEPTADMPFQVQNLNKSRLEHVLATKLL